MATRQPLHMNPGEGEASYARNSMLQSAEQSRMKPVIEEAVTSFLGSIKSHGCVAIADLGCSSGPNALALVSCAVDAIFQHYAQHDEQVPPELRVVLNDLPDNDFNSVAKRLMDFQDTSHQRNNRVTVAIVPGSFYKRLFTRCSLHLILSSNSLHWLSTAPEDLRINGVPMYDGDDDLRKARKHLVEKAYARQFKEDFKLFLNLRAQELVPGGKMVISLPGRCNDSDHARDGLAFILNDMVKRGVILREQLDTFYVPMHKPSYDELREIIEEDCSFKINKMLVHDHMSSVDKISSVTPKKLALVVRAAFEPMLVQHFGKSDQVVEEFVTTTEWYLSTGRQPRLTADVLLCVSLTKMI